MICGEFLVKPSSWQVKKGRQSSEQLDHKNRQPTIPLGTPPPGEQQSQGRGPAQGLVSSPGLMEMNAVSHEKAQPFVHKSVPQPEGWDRLKAFHEAFELLDN